MKCRGTHEVGFTPILMRHVDMNDLIADKNPQYLLPNLRRQRYQRRVYSIGPDTTKRHQPPVSIDTALWQEVPTHIAIVEAFLVLVTAWALRDLFGLVTCCEGDVDLFLRLILRLLVGKRNAEPQDMMLRLYNRK